tara:strand:- start:2612 stop:4600 length:1989 start_codon:yes stop_codon:yes gene_type:complete
MADIDDELRRILEGAGKDITKIREALVGSSRALIKNTANQKDQQKVVKELIKRNEKLRDHLEENNLLSEEQNKVIDDNIDIIKKHSEETKRASKGTFNFTKILIEIGKFFFKTAMAVVKTGVEFAKTSAHIRTFGDALEAGLDQIPGLGPVMKVFGKELDDQTQMFKGLAQSGATFGSSIVTMGEAAYQSGMPLVQFQELIQNNTSTLARLFGSVNAGIPQITGLARALKRFTMEELSGFGLTMEETTEMLTTVAELERARGRAGQLTQADLLARTKEYAKNLTTLSRLTGESVSELDKRNRQLAADGVFAAKLAQMDEDQAERVRVALAALPASAQQAAKEFIGLGVPIGDLGKGLSVFSGGKFEETLLGFTKRSGKATEEEIVAMKSAFNEIGTTGIQGGDAIASAALAGNTLASEALNTFVQMAGTAVDQKEFARQSALALDDINASTKALVSLPDQFGLVQAELQSVNLNLMKGLILDANSMGGKALQAFTDGNTDISKEMADQLKGFTNTLLGKNKKDDDRESLGYGQRLKDGGMGLSANYGTPGFQEFGSGTRATLHGSEMVLPERNVGELAKQLALAVGSMTTTNNNTNANAGDVITTNTQAIDMTTLNTNTSELIDLNKKLAQHLNTLVTIGAMTEKNTKNFNNNLANMSGSLV